MSGIRRIIAWGLLVGSLSGGQASAAALDPSSPVFTFYSQGDLSLTSGNYAFTVGSNGPALGLFTGPVFTTVATGFVFNGINVFDFHSLNIGAGVNISTIQSSASGPIALLSSTSISIGGSIDVSGATGPFGLGGGPGAQNFSTGGNGAVGRVPGSIGPGGILDTGGGGGGFGGAGSSASDAYVYNSATNSYSKFLSGGSGGSPMYANLANFLQGGTAGGVGGGAFANGQGGPGFGGGAIELGAVGTVAVSGLINANGGVGGPASTTTGGGIGAGGGGSGGGVFLHGTSVAISGQITAIGGAGGASFSGFPQGGSAGVGGGGLVLAEFTGPYGSFTDTGTVNVGNGRFDIASVPEPASLVLLGISALGGVAVTGWRRVRRRS